MKNRNKFSPPRSAPSRKGNFSQRNNDNYVDLLQKYGNNTVNNKNKISKTHKKVFDDVTIDRELISSIFGPPKIIIKESINDMNNYRYKQELSRKKNSRLTEDQRTMLFDRLSLSRVIVTDDSSPISNHTTRTNAYEQFDYNKKFIESRFKGVDETISLAQLELILHFFAIIDRNINEKPLISQEIIPLCQIDDETYDSEKLKESLIQSFKKSNESDFWLEVSNCIISARLNGKMKVFPAKSPPKTAPPKKQKNSFKITGKSSIKRAIQFSDDDSYTSDEDYAVKREPNRELGHLLFENSDDSRKSDNLNSKNEEKDNKETKTNKTTNKETNKQNSNENQNSLFIEEEEEFNESEFENLKEEEKNSQNETKNEEEEEFKEEGSNKNDNKPTKKAKFSKEILKMKQKGNDHLSTEKAHTNSHKRRKNFKKQNQDDGNLLKNNDNDKLSEYEYNYYSEEQRIKSSLTFDDLINEAASQHFDNEEFQSIADQASNSKSFISYDSIDYSNDEDLYIKTKRRWKHKHKKSSSQNSNPTDQQKEKEHQNHHIKKQKNQNNETHQEINNDNKNNIESIHENSEDTHGNNRNKQFQSDNQEEESNDDKSNQFDEDNSEVVHKNREFYDGQENSDVLHGYQSKPNSDSISENDTNQQNSAYKLNTDDLRILENYLDDEDKQNSESQQNMDEAKMLDDINEEEEDEDDDDNLSNENEILDDRMTTDEKQNSGDFDMLDDQASSEDQHNNEELQEYEKQQNEPKEQKLGTKEKVKDDENQQNYYYYNQSLSAAFEEEEDHQKIGNEKFDEVNKNCSISEDNHNSENNRNNKNFLYQSDDYNTEDASDEPMFFERLQVLPAGGDLKEDIGVQTDSELNGRDVNSRGSSSEFGRYPVTVPIEDVDTNELKQFDKDFSDNQSQE